MRGLDGRLGTPRGELASPTGSLAGPEACSGDPARASHSYLVIDRPIKVARRQGDERRGGTSQRLVAPMPGRVISVHIRGRSA